jgi:hypothetical protein
MSWFKLDLKPNEELVRTYRQAEWVLLKPALIVMALIYAPWWFLIRIEMDTSLRRLLLFWTFLVLLYGAKHFVLWLLNSYVLTNQRIINASFSGIFHRQVTESPLERILNVSYEVKGVTHSLLDFGNVLVQIVGMVEPIVLKNVSHPEHIKNFIWDEHIKHGGGRTIDPEHLSQLQQQIGYSAQVRVKGKTPHEL